MDSIDLALSYFDRGYSCSQSVLVAFAPQLGLPEELALRVAAPFGGGIGRLGEVCGAISGAIMALGLRYGGFDPSDQAAKDRLYAQVQQLAHQFQEQHRTLLCRGLLGLDLSIPQELQQARRERVFASQCPRYVRTATELVAELLEVA